MRFANRDLLVIGEVVLYRSGVKPARQPIGCESGGFTTKPANNGLQPTIGALRVSAFCLGPAARRLRLRPRPLDRQASPVRRFTKMSFDLETYARLRPFLYHLTHRHNIDRIICTRRLQSAASLLRLAGMSSMATEKREKSVRISINGCSVILCDQAPLYSKNAQFIEGWSLSEFIAYLNEFVFFWAGSEKGPVDYGVHHFERYYPEGPLIVRVRMMSLCCENPNTEPLFCRYNSGSPRWSGGKPSPRGPDTFSTANDSEFTAGSVKEVVFRGSITIPNDCEYSPSIYGPWSPLADEAG